MNARINLLKITICHKVTSSLSHPKPNVCLTLPKLSETQDLRTPLQSHNLYIYSIMYKQHVIIFTV